MKYITFDEYYSASEYKKFIQAAKNNGIEYEEFISTKAPYNWYLKVDEFDVPNFLNYDEATKQERRKMLKVLEPVFANEKYLLQRRENDNPKDFSRFVTFKAFDNVIGKPATIVKNINKQELIRISKELGTTIWVLGKERGWNLFLSENPFIKNYVGQDSVILDKKKSDLNKPGELELALNKILNIEHFSSKRTQQSHFKNGKFFPVKE